MPVYEQTYQTWDARFGARARWLTVAAQELRIAYSAALFRRLLLLAALPFLMCLLMMVISDLMTTNPNMLLRSLVRQVRFTNIDAQFFRMYLGLTTPFVYLFSLLVGAGSICNDYRHNLLEVYFAKPLSKWSYFVGKFAAVCAVPWCLTAVASLVLFGLHMLLAPTAGLLFLQESYWVPFACLALSFAMVAPAAWFVMACSAVSKSAGYASVIACALLFMNGALGNVLSDILREQNMRCISFTRSVMHLSNVLFGAPTRITLHWGYIVAGLSMVSLLCALLVFRRIRAVEVGS